MNALIIEGRVAALAEDGASLSTGGCALIVPVGPEVEVGWTWRPEGCAPSSDSDADPVRVARSYALADAQDIHELKEVLADLLGW